MNENNDQCDSSKTLPCSKKLDLQSEFDFINQIIETDEKQSYYQKIQALRDDGFQIQSQQEQSQSGKTSQLDDGA